MIGPSEQSSSRPDIDQVLQAPGHTARAAAMVYVGVLKLDSPLLAIFPGRVVPVMERHAVRVRVLTPAGLRTIACMRIPWPPLIDEHKRAIEANVAAALSQPVEAARQRLEETGYYAVPKREFAAIVQGRKAP